MKKLSIILLVLSQALAVCSQDFSFIYDGLERTYKVHLPADYDDQTTYPLVINMHGLGSNAFQQELYSRFSELADEEGIVVVYPNGINNMWNVYSPSGVDDVGFISALIDTMATNYGIDLKRVYACGMSMGGYMSHRLACQLEERIAAIASVTGLLVFSPCVPSRPVPVLQIHGTDDSVVPYEGIPETIDFWTGWDDCPEEPEVIEVPDTDTTDQSTVTITTYFPCSDSTRVILYTVNGGDHTWPGSPPIIGVTNQDIDANVEIWNFFRQYTLDGPTGVPEHYPNEAGLKVYPVPAEDHVTIELIEPGNYSWSLNIFDISGRPVARASLGKGNLFHYNTPTLDPGTYLISVSNGYQRYQTIILLK